MNIYDYLLLALIAAGAFFALRAVVRQKKRGGGCSGCCGSCASCSACKKAPH